jgi:hypothetical protein
MRLIDADALIERIVAKIGNAVERGDNFDHLEIIDLIAEEPTAYDVGKVVEELLENIKGCHNTITIFDTKAYVRFDKAVEIVRRGGIDGN